MKTQVWGSLDNAINSPDRSVLFRKLFLEGKPSNSISVCSPKPPAITILNEDLPGFVRIRVDASNDGFLFLADSWYPGWIAQVDGIDTQIYKADIVFRAVHVRQGVHTVEFIYRPKSFYIGGGITFLGLVYMVLIFLFSKHRVK